MGGWRKGALKRFNCPCASTDPCLVPSPLPPEERPGMYCLRMCVIFPVFWGGFVKLCIITRTLVTYTNRACSFLLNKALHLWVSDSLLAKAVSCSVSVVKADCVQ